jgi:hypothetical protein
MRNLAQWTNLDRRNKCHSVELLHRQEDPMGVVMEQLALSVVAPRQDCVQYRTDRRKERGVPEGRGRAVEGLGEMDRKLWRQWELLELAY